MVLLTKETTLQGLAAIGLGSGIVVGYRHLNGLRQACFLEAMDGMMVNVFTAPQPLWQLLLIGLSPLALIGTAIRLKVSSKTIWRVTGFLLVCAAVCFWALLPPASCVGRTDLFLS